jgi:hypothetical protein
MTRKFETIDLSTFGLNIDKKQTFVYHRDLIPSLSEAERERSEIIRDARYDDERIAYEREYLKKVDHRDSYESSPIKKRTTRNVIKMRQEELLKKVPRNVEVAINRLTTRALYDSDKEDKTDLSDDQYSPNAAVPLGDSEISGGGDDDDSVSTDEDLVVTTTRTTGIMTRTGQQRRVQRHRNLSPDEDDDDEDEDKHEYHRKVQEAKTQHRRRNKLKRLKKRREQVKTKKEEFENKHELELNYSSDFKPPDWLTRTNAKSSPYIPQIGDIVMYFIQGHELYINEVKDKKMYEIDEKTLPWNKCESIDVS